MIITLLYLEITFNMYILIKSNVYTAMKSSLPINQDKEKEYWQGCGTTGTLTQSSEKFKMAQSLENLVTLKILCIHYTT